MFSRKHEEMGLTYNSTMLSSKHRHIRPTTVLIVGTLFIFCSFSLFHRVISQTDISWDVLIFTQNWPISVCNQWMEKGHVCRSVPNDTWTIHGIWPTKFGKIGPGFCDSSRPFVPEAIYGIESLLEKFWTPVQKHKKITALWSHEWQKHGTCAAVVPMLSTEFQYFNQGLKWIKDYNMYTILQKAGITPGNQYNVTEIWDGIKKVLTKDPQIACYENKLNTSVLLEVRICFNKTLQLVDCDGTVIGVSQYSKGYHNLTNCKIDKFVQYSLNSSAVQAHKIESNEDLFVETYKFLKVFQWLTGGGY